MAIPCVSASAAEALLRHKIIRLLQREGLLDEELTRRRLSWRHCGFSVHSSIRPRRRRESLMRVVAFITEPHVIRRVVDHLAASARRAAQGPRSPSRRRHAGGGGALPAPSSAAWPGAAA